MLCRPPQIMCELSLRLRNLYHSLCCRLEEQLAALERKEKAGAQRGLSGLAAVNKRNTGQNFTNAFKVRLTFYIGFKEPCVPHSQGLKNPVSLTHASMNATPTPSPGR